MKECINTQLPAFKEIQKELNVSEPVLEQILYKLQKDYGHLDFTPKQIDKYLQGKQLKFGENSLKLYEQEYKEPLIVSPKEYNQQLAIAKSVFPSDAVTSYQTADGNYTIRVAKPTKQDNISTKDHDPIKTIGQILIDSIDNFYRNSIDSSVVIPFIHKFRGELRLNLHEYLPSKDSNIYTSVHPSLEAVQALLSDLGLQNVIEATNPTSNILRLRLNEFQYQDYIKQSQSVYKLSENTAEGRKILSILNFLKGRLGIEYRVISESEAERITGISNKNRNAFYKNGVAYFIESKKISADIAAEEMLHPLVGALKKSNPEIFKELLEDAKKLFPKLYIEILDAYKSKRYSKEEQQNIYDNELVTQALSRAFVEDRNNTPLGHKVKDLIKKFGRWFTSLFSNQKSLELDKIPVTLNNFAQLINSDIELKFRRVNQYYANQEQAQEQMKEQDKKLEQIYTINEQFNNMLTSSTLTSTDIIEASDIIADLLSNKIDELDSKRDQVKELLLQRNPKDTTDVNKLSRFELVKAIGIQHFIDLVKRDFIRSKRTATAENVTKITEVVKNWDYFISRTKSTISETEGIHLVISDIGEKTFAKDSSLVDQYNEDGSNVQDQVEDGQLSWQIENNAIDPVTSITQLVKQRLRSLYILKDNGKRDESNNPIYDHIKTKWGTDAKVGHVKAAKCLLHWLNNKATLQEMIDVLNKKSKKYPWVTQLIPILTDKSGKYTTEQCQFFSTFYKPFMKFSNVGFKGGKLVSRSLNEHPFLTIAMKTIEAQYKLGQHPMIVKGLAKGSNALNLHYNNLQKLMQNYKGNKEAIFAELRVITKGLGFEINVSELQLEQEDVKDLMYQLGIISSTFSKNANNSEYNPFTYKKGENGIRSNLMRFFEKLTDTYEEEAVTSFYEGGKMRQSYLLPSFLSMFTNKFHLEEEAFKRFLESEFNTEFFKNTKKFGWDSNNWKKGWKNVWLQLMVSDINKRKNFKCKTSITFDGSTYMKGMTAEEYTLAMITEFFGENSKDSDPLFLANFRVPIESNKPSAEYITFYARGGAFYKDDLVTDFMSVFSQELSRIQTVKLRRKLRESKLKSLKERLDRKEITEQQYNMLKYSIEQEAITNFDTRGRSFVYLDFLNYEVENNTELGNLIKDATEGKDIDKAVMSKLASEAIRNAIQSRVDRIIESFIDNGVFNSCKAIEKLGTTDSSVRSKLELMLWNDAFASTQIMQLLITDPAFLKNTDDIQKRFAQVHASGTRANLAAVDFDGNPVSDGVHRSITLKDVEGFTSNIIDNLTIALDKKINDSKNESERIAWEAFKDKLVGEKGIYRGGINLTDAQAYSCPTSYRKKALMFGLWSKEAEETYNRIKEGNYTYSDIATVFQPFKPFVYGNSIESSGVAGPITNIRVPVQNKNAECLLVMADAIISSIDTGKPNLLRALFNVMEESHFEYVNGKKVYKQDGIDTVNFESAVKSGNQGKIDTQTYANGKTITTKDNEGNEHQIVVDAERAFEDQLRILIYNTESVDGNTVITYNRNTVKHLSYENYCMQQAVPEHFLDHSQLEGSQQRAIIPSDLAAVDNSGNIIYYEVGSNKTNMTAKELQERYDYLHSEKVKKGIKEIEELFNLRNSTPQQRKEALSKLLVEQFLEDGRYSGDMLYLVTLNKETGDFPISLEDPSIKTQVEQAINSIIKSRVNKLKMKGGPLVQMSNFGMSNELKIRFLDKEGNLLKDRSLFESDKAYKEYITNNQAGIAHFEVIAPAYTEAIFREFMDKEGNISVEALEILNPDLLKMIGYRIPTEAKYSIAPLKIVGFAPREMGDVIILPAEITAITGSDFDIDKEYCMRKTLDIISKIKNSDVVSSKLSNSLSNELRSIVKDSRLFSDRFVNDPYNKKLWISEGLTKEQYKEVLKSYLGIKYEVADATGLDAIDNEIFDMSYSVLTSESNVTKALKPGGFEEHKKLAYVITAYKNAEIRSKYNFDTLLNMDIKELGKLIERVDKNLMFLDTQIEYYNHNNSASSLLGISAVNSVAHAMLVNDNIGLNLSDITIPSIDGFTFNSKMKLDPSVDTNGASIAETLGSCVAASADAAKDPVLNLMNLNPQTFNVYTTLIRLGVPNSTAALLMSSNVLTSAIIESNARSLAGEYCTPEKILRDKLGTDILEEYGYSLNSPIFEESITREELIRSLTDTNDVNLNFKITNALVSLFKASRAVRLADQVTRFNSISSAVGPSTIDNIIFQYKLDNLDSESSLVDMETSNTIDSSDLLARHKTLYQFSRAYDLAREILIDSMPQTKAFIESIDNMYTMTPITGLEAKFGVPNIVANDRSLMSKLRDFFINYIAVKKGLIKYDELAKLSTEFPKTLTDKKREHHDNYLMQNLYLDIDSKSGVPIISMNISKVEKTSRDSLSAAWTELYTKDKEFAINLFKYSFFRGGLGFSPKTFMSVLPVQMKLAMSEYIDLFNNVQSLDSKESTIMYRQFVSNNYKDNKLVPTKYKLQPNEKGEIRISINNSRKNEFKELKFFKIKDGDTYRLFECMYGYEAGPLYRVYKEIPKLGADGNFIEVSDSNITKSYFDVEFEQVDEGNQKLNSDVNDIPVDSQSSVVEAKRALDKIQQIQGVSATATSFAEAARQEFINDTSQKLSELMGEQGFTPINTSTTNDKLNKLDLC